MFNLPTTDRAKLPSLADSTESKGEDSKDGGPVIDVPQAVSKEEEKHSSLDKPAQPPPYEPGTNTVVLWPVWHCASIQWHTGIVV